MSTKTELIVRLVRNCHYCQPMSGCIMSGLKSKSTEELFSYLNALGGKAVNRIISFHEACPYRSRIPV